MDRCKENPDNGLIFSADDSNNLLVGYSDADWAGDLDTRHSTSGFVFKFIVTLLAGAVKDNLICQSLLLNLNMLR